MTLIIEITSDFICPWCLAAEARLKRAIAQLNPTVDIQVVWHPFELNPDMPEAGMDRKAYRSNKFGSWEYSKQLDAKTVQATQADGIEFHYDQMNVTPNTLKAHRLTWFADKQGKATAMAERIFRAYFSEGQDIGDTATLVNLAAEIGINAAQSFLFSDEGVREIRQLEQQSVSQGVQSVPTIHIGNEVLWGAQPVDVMVMTLQKAINKLKIAK